MLQRLYIRNYAIIDELEIEFKKGLTIITGETGAGKSILMGALGLVLGNRAETSVLLNPDEKCIVEAVFEISGDSAIADWLLQQEIDLEETLILRREISPNGKSRSFINDTPVNLHHLREAAETLVDLHRQYDTQSLGEDSFQTEVLDALAGQLDLVKVYKSELRVWHNSLQKLKQWENEQNEASRELDYQQFLFQELDSLNFKPNELETLEAEADLLANADKIKQALSQVNFALQESEPSLVQQLKQLAGLLTNVSAALPDLSEQANRLSSLQIELQDISREVNKLNHKILLDPERLEKINERISAGYRLFKKHQVQTTAELLTLQEELDRKISAFSDRTEKIAQQRQLVSLNLKKVLEIGDKLHKGRLKVLSLFEKTTHQYLAQMEMANAQIKVNCILTKGENGEIIPGSLGIDKVSIGFDANKTGRFESLEKVASGGERSRLMLAIKAQVAKSVALPALIFDEIDTGISGEASRQVGLLLRQLAMGHQVIAITHQPQIAAKAHSHFFVFKQEKNGKVRTQMRLLNPEERIQTIAKMLSGESVTQTSITIATEMMGNP